jgi:hypothetical protein
MEFLVTITMLVPDEPPRRQFGMGSAVARSLAPVSLPPRDTCSDCGVRRCHGPLKSISRITDAVSRLF